ncbi:MAG: hypothetical protein K0U36_06710, partial [Alphaproteobacteria bacterium]|nr:hypothetical protein [Alphaproteobacteria bacterium]
GQQTSHFEHVYGPENSMTFFNRQEEGTGTKIAPMVGWRLSDATVLEVRYVQEIWTVADSETAYILVRRPNDSGVYEGEILGYYEPRNNSRKNVLFVGIGSSM